MDKKKSFIALISYFRTARANLIITLEINFEFLSKGKSPITLGRIKFQSSEINVQVLENGVF